MLRAIALFLLTVQVTACTSTKKGNELCTPTVVELSKKFYIRAVGDSLAPLNPENFNGFNWNSFKFLNGGLLSSSGIIACPDGREIKPKYWEYDISYRNKRLIVRSHKRLWAYHERRKDWVGDLGVPAYSEEIYAVDGKVAKTDAVLILKLPYYNSEALARLNKEYEQYEKTKYPSSNPLLLNRLLVAALNGDSVSKQRLLNYSQVFPNSAMDESINENIQLLQDYENWLAKGGKRTCLTKEEFPILN